MIADRTKSKLQDWTARLRRDKIAETRKKMAVNGSMDEDDYHSLVAPDGFDWKPASNHANGDFHGYMAWAVNYRSLTEAFPPVVVPYNAVVGNYFKILQRYRKLRWNPDYRSTSMCP